MPERKAISTVAAITLGAVSCVLGLGLVARSARAMPEPREMVAEVGSAGTASLTLGMLGIEPGAVALIGLSGVVSFWPGKGRRRIGAELLGSDDAAAPGSEVLTSAA